MSHDPSTHEWGFVASLTGGGGADGPAATERPGTTDRPATERQGARVNAFRVGETYLLRHYFESAAVFDALEPYYNARRYRFEVPVAAFDDVVGLLGGRGYDVQVVDDHTRFTVVVRKYTDHPEVVFDDAVLEVSTDEYNAFVLADRAAVETAVRNGATRLAETPLRLRFAADPRVGQTTVADVTDGRR